jgi:phosphatidylethanolamine/phosphatidyl-N-methylethanolamine N-methyltransferase
VVPVVLAIRPQMVSLFNLQNTAWRLLYNEIDWLTTWWSRPRFLLARFSRAAMTGAERERSVCVSRHEKPRTGSRQGFDPKEFVEKLKLGARKARDELRRVARSKKDEADTKQPAFEEAWFLKNWVESPLKTGSVIPSSKELARKMAEGVDLSLPGLVVELGPGTGPVTQALLDRGLPPERLVLVEYSNDFVKLLRKRFPGVTVLKGDAYDLQGTLAERLTEPLAAIVSGLPLFNKPESERLSLLQTALDLLAPNAPFIQFTYLAVSPVPLIGGFQAKKSQRVWKNIPPACVWSYSRPTDGASLRGA